MVIWWYGMSCARPYALLRGPDVWCLYIMLSKSYLPWRCDWKDVFFFLNPHIAFRFRLCTKKYNYNDKLISTSLPNFAFLAQGSGTEKKPTKSLHPDYSKVFLRPSILHSCRHCEPSLDTPRKINMEPENTPLEKENHLPNHHFQVQAVNLPGCISFCG